MPEDTIGIKMPDGKRLVVPKSYTEEQRRTVAQNYWKSVNKPKEDTSSPIQTPVSRFLEKAQAGIRPNPVSQAVGNTVIGAGRGVMDTAFGVDNIARKAIGMGPSPEDLRKQKAVTTPQGGTQELGKTAEQIAEFFIPGMDEEALAAKLPKLGKAGKIAIGVMKDALQTGAVEGVHERSWGGAAQGAMTGIAGRLINTGVERMLKPTGEVLDRLVAKATNEARIKAKLNKDEALKLRDSLKELFTQADGAKTEEAAAARADALKNARMQAKEARDKTWGLRQQVRQVMRGLSKEDKAALKEPLDVVRGIAKKTRPSQVVNALGKSETPDARLVNAALSKLGFNTKEIEAIRSQYESAITAVKELRVSPKASKVQDSPDMALLRNISNQTKPSGVSNAVGKTGTSDAMTVNSVLKKAGYNERAAETVRRTSRDAQKAATAKQKALDARAAVKNPNQPHIFTKKVHVPFRMWSVPTTAAVGGAVGYGLGSLAGERRLGTEIGTAAGFGLANPTAGAGIRKALTSGVTKTGAVGATNEMLRDNEDRDKKELDKAIAERKRKFGY